MHDASHDARVRAHFVMIERFGLDEVLLHLHSTGAGRAATTDTSSWSAKDHRIMHYLDTVRDIAQQERFAWNRSLLILEDSPAIVKFADTAGSLPMARGSKIIITSKHDQTAVGLSPMEDAMRTKNMSKEEYWYHLQALAFHSTTDDPVALAHPTLAATAKEIVTVLNGSFLGMHVLIALMRSNPRECFWRAILQSLMYLFCSSNSKRIEADMDYVQEIALIGQIALKLVLPMRLTLRSCSITKQGAILN
uniref:Uncharacterized protein n=1 Tax=Oryza glumipatula TaxID=40148 RepID=A0A0D9YUV4_9ORYZ